MFLLFSAALFAIYLGNVLLGAYGKAQFMGDVGEMLMLFAATIVFVIDILRREAAEKSKDNNQS
ncbi:hypothetical protein PSA7680_03145 [Pseudoruegeria aquimaris]|uniref:Uncharacterized protein n=1 Tax=Pseudoruegeria aquimaris TaxID=393663 RepID=A0A1Y5TB62_9RHOB|nr:hypothetical protein [Pseudoruegeria aquimaris]SLN59853.1 hypothetical protein PSA7680_03145 [Pseudoruegeria aquimaris]